MQRRLLLALSAITLAVALQRWLAWSAPPGRPLTGLPDPPAGLQLRAWQVDRVAVSPATYQLAFLVQQLDPAAALQTRHLVATASGTVAFGRSRAGRWSLQTCLMSTETAAVTHRQMLAQVLHTSPRGVVDRTKAALAAALLGRPWRDRQCRLMVLQARPGLKHNQARQELLQGWQELMTFTR